MTGHPHGHPHSQDRPAWHLGRACNATWQWAGDNALLDGVAQGADWLIFVECRTKADQPVPVQKYLGPHWDVQQNTSDGEHAGSATAIRKGSGLHVVSSELTLLSHAGNGVQPRHLRTTVVEAADGRRARFGAGHLALEYTGRQEEGQRTLAKWAGHGNEAMERAEHDGHNGHEPTPWLFAGDINGPAAPIAHAMHAAGFHGAHPMAMTWSRGLHGMQQPDRMHAGADHFVLTRKVFL